MFKGGASKLGVQQDFVALTPSHDEGPLLLGLLLNLVQCRRRIHAAPAIKILIYKLPKKKVSRLVNESYHVHNRPSFKVVKKQRKGQSAVSRGKILLGSYG